SVPSRSCSQAPSTTAHFFPLSLHDALPIYPEPAAGVRAQDDVRDDSLDETCLTERSLGFSDACGEEYREARLRERATERGPRVRSEEHTSELQSRENLVCRLLLEKKKA